MLPARARPRVPRQPRRRVPPESRRGGRARGPPPLRPGPLAGPLGDAAVLVELGTTVDLELNRRVRGLSARIAQATAMLPGWGVPIPGAASILVPVDPLEPGVAAAAERLRHPG